MNTKKDFTGIQIEMDTETDRVTAIRYCAKNDKEVRSINRILMDFCLTFFNRFNYNKSSTKGGRLMREAWKPSAADKGQFHNLSIPTGEGETCGTKEGLDAFGTPINQT